LPNAYARFPRTSKQYSAPLAFVQLPQNGAQFGYCRGPLDIVTNSSYDDITSTHLQQKIVISRFGRRVHVDRSPVDALVLWCRGEAATHN
jgi:hypothetical protein